MFARLKPRLIAFVPTVFFAVMFLVFIQLLSDFVESTYAFGLLKTSLTAEAASVLLLLSPLALLPLRKGMPKVAITVIGELVLLCRVVEPMLDTRGRMYVTALGVGLFMILFPSLVWDARKAGGRSTGRTLGLGLALSLGLSILFRAIGSGTDASTYGMWQVLGWVLIVVAAVLLPVLSRFTTPPEVEAAGTAAVEGRPASGWKTIGLALGTTGVLGVAYFAFAAPNVLARWTGENYITVISVLVVVLAVFGLLFTRSTRFRESLTPPVVLGWNGGLLIFLVTTIIIHQMDFPAVAGAYPVFQGEVPPLLRLPFLFALVLSPVIVVDFMLFGEELTRTSASPRAVAGAFALSGFFLLVMVFAHIFTTVYDYIPAIGPFFRDKFWLVYLVLLIAVSAPVLLVGKRTFRLVFGEEPPDGFRFLPAALALAGLLTMLAAALLAPRPAADGVERPTLRLVTYNIQQGYTETGQRGLHGQLSLLRELQADVIGLQETDTNRIAGGNNDLVRFFADHLEMYSYYGPKTVNGTFGIALLSKHPIQNARTLYMFSAGEQTATIEAQVTVGGRTFTVFVTHLGNGGPIVQQEQLLQEVEGKGDVIAMGDFNFEPDTDQYRITLAMLDDLWLAKWPQGVDDQGVDPADRIDHFFASKGMLVEDIRYVFDPASDHPAVVAEISW